jgi:hypothetical protein
MDKFTNDFVTSPPVSFGRRPCGFRVKWALLAFQKCWCHWHWTTQSDSFCLSTAPQLLQDATDSRSTCEAFQICYAHEVEQWIRKNYGRVVTVYQISELFERAAISAELDSSPASGPSSDLTTLQFWAKEMRLVKAHNITRAESLNQGRNVIQFLRQQQQWSGRLASAQCPQ